MADGEAIDSHESLLPSVRSVYNLVTANEFGAIQSLLTPLTLHHRRWIVNQKIYQKTLVYHACEFGCGNLVKYFLDECEADVEDGYCDGTESVSPLLVCIKRQDIVMINFLIRRGAYIGNKPNERCCLEYALLNGYFLLQSFLKIHRNKKDRFIYFVSHRDTPRHNLRTVIPWLRGFACDMNGNNFLIGAVYGDILQLKNLLKFGVPQYFKTTDKNNPLCLAILNDQKNVQDFLINYRLFSLREYALALEYCGAKLIIFASQKQKGLECWRKSLRIRIENLLGFSDKKVAMQNRNDVGTEFQSEEELDRLQDTNGGLRMQALLVYLRLTSPSDDSIQKAFLNVANCLVSGHDLTCLLKALYESYKFPALRLRTKKAHTLKTLNTMFSLFRTRFVGDQKNMDDVLYKFRSLIDFLDINRWKELLSPETIFYNLAYSKLLNLVIENVIAAKTFHLSQENTVWVEDSIRHLLQWTSEPFPTTLLHKAIECMASLSVVHLLITCSDDVNYKDEEGNTPLHIASSLPEDNTFVSTVTHLLINAGGHIDSVNNRGARPMDELKWKGVIENPLEYLSLQCLAARVLYENKRTEENLSKALQKFIRLHSS